MNTTFLENLVNALREISASNAELDWGLIDCADLCGTRTLNALPLPYDSLAEARSTTLTSSLTDLTLLSEMNLISLCDT